jgi:hypothetical protein
MEKYNLIKSQNDLLTNAITSSSTKNNTYKQKSIYQLGDAAFLSKINNILFIIYYFLVFIVVYYVLIDKDYGKYTKAGLLFVFIGFPYLLNLVEYYLVIILKYLYSVFNLNAYENGNW